MLLLEMSGPKQIVSLGAGFDTTYFYVQKISDKIDDTLFIEIDYPNVINRKIRLAQTNLLLHPHIDEHNCNGIMVYK